MKKRLHSLMLALCLVFGLVACAKAPTWQEQYDLGVRYLSEGNYQEAIIAFTAAIEIDPRQAQAYVKRGDTYSAQGKLDQAVADYRLALTLDPSMDILSKLDEWERELLTTQLEPIICNLDLPMTIDNVVLGQTSIDEAKAIYGSYPYAMSNLMNDDTEDTVYVCFGMDGTPIPAGHEAMEFGFIFAGTPGGVVDYMITNQQGLTALGALQANDPAEVVLNLFGFPETVPQVPLQWGLNNGGELDYIWHQDGDYDFVYKINKQTAQVWVRNNLLYGVYFEIEND